MYHFQLPFAEKRPLISRKRISLKTEFIKQNLLNARILAYHKIRLIKFPCYCENFMDPHNYIYAQFE